MSSYVFVPSSPDMKMVAFILSVLIFWMTVMPCADAHDTVCHSENAISLTEGHVHTDGQDENEGCTPFCVCECCGTTVTFLALPALDIPVEEVVFAYDFHYSFHYSFTFAKALWRPPATV